MAITRAKTPASPPAGKEQKGNKKTKRHKVGGSPIIAAAPGPGTLRAARFAVFFTAAAWLGYLGEQAYRLSGSDLTARTLIEACVYLTLVTLLAASCSAYLLTRIGYFERIKSHRRVPRSTIDDYFDQATPSLTVLVPSYREDSRVIRQTLLSAALQEYPNLKVVLLVDDPPNSSDPEQRRALERARGLPTMVEDSLREPHGEFAEALTAFEQKATTDRLADTPTLDLVASHYEKAALWLDAEKQSLAIVDHTDEFLAIEVFERLAADLRTTADAIRAVAERGTEAGVSRKRVHQFYLRLERIFNARLTSFERKQFASLSHEANKAMNLNSYLGLMGGEYEIVSSPGGSVLVRAEDRQADLIIPNSDYVLTLDADSILLPEYCLRLVYFMEQAENADVAVAQTPYSAFRGAPTSIERIAGATTDIQHIVHQGLTRHNATFWVGANAVIRKRALDELVEESDESGFVIRRYIKDRTVIEDTESSIDLRARGWRLYNYPERLSYSATPSDFGTLVIQRQRWANGGLVILPGLIRLLFQRREGVARPSFSELFLRSTYLASISWATISLLLLLFYPFDGRLLSRFALVTALPYFWAMANDLHRCGYNRRDVLAVYGFNLILLPVNLAGTVQSVAQAIGGHKIAFARTPKVRNRTVAPLAFICVPVLLIAWSARTLSQDIETGAYAHGVFAAANLIMTTFACVLLIGVHNMALDALVNVREFIKRPAPLAEDTQQVPHWASVLYVGSSVTEETERSASLAAALAAQDRYRANPMLIPEAYLVAAEPQKARKARPARVHSVTSEGGGSTDTWRSNS